eukprot:TRINITY_DN7964_c0_g1_i1.p1 TRINITY_DN7964_c0_g1~~TRINITY_DN7964_c0_g1_i1.p1  ORF type:complete len:750 (+),score=274.17 TRINITY_DN7964_c0_g1_i1:137-2251(+)
MAAPPTQVTAPVAQPRAAPSAFALPAAAQPQAVAGRMEMLRQQRRMYSTPPPPPEPVGKGPARKKKTILDLRRKHRKNEPITMLTAYDYPTARIMDDEGVDMILVGDSLGMVVHGYDSTVPVTMDDVVLHSKAVRRGAPHTFVVGDMPFGSYEITPADAATNALRLAKETGCDAVKLEGGARVAPAVEAITAAGILVVGHIGLTPQSSAAMGGFRVQGKSALAAQTLLADARALEKAGVCSLVIEGVPPEVAEYVTSNIGVPTIGIGAGGSTSGQVLVLHDMAGLNPRSVPKFCRRFADAGAEIRRAVRGYVDEVGARNFPAPEHSYKMPESEKAKLLALTHAAAVPDIRQAAAAQKSVGASPITVVPRAGSSKTRIAVVGGGAMGSFIAGSLARCGTSSVWMISGWADHVAAIRNGGLRLDGLGGGTQSMISTLKATADPLEAVASEGLFDVVLVLVKSTHTEVAAQKAAQLVDPANGIIVSLQNGMGNRERILEIVNAPDRVVQGVTSHGAMLQRKAHVRHMGMGSTTLALPTENEAARQRIEAFARRMTLAGIETGTEVTERLESVLWGKLVINAGINPLSALFRVPNGVLAENPMCRDLLAQTVEEAAAVASSKGVSLPFTASPVDAVVDVARKTAGNRSSMLCDVLRGVETEIDAINGAVVRTGKELGVPVSMNMNLVSMIRSGADFAQISGAQVAAAA